MSNATDPEVMSDLTAIQGILDDVRIELLNATQKFGKFNSAHEGYAVILEELDELWEEIKFKGSTPQRTRAEAIQVAAMAVRFVKDIIGE